jgi:nicotinamidase-related amidase
MPEWGWEKFFTEQDREHQKLVGKQGLFGFGESPAVIVIDDYYSVLGFERLPLLESMKTWPHSCGLEGWEAIDKTVELLASAREHNVPIIYVRGLREGLPRKGPRKWRNREDTSDYMELIPEEWRNRAGDIVDEIAPQPGDAIIQKAAPSAFNGTPLLKHLISNRIDTLIACGETVSGCVRATVTDGSTFGFKMGLVAECSFDRTQASYWMSLFDMHQKYCDVVDRFQAADYFAGISAKSKALVGATA